MKMNSKQLQIPEVFDFPFPPYEIQQKFMKILYKCLEEEKLGIFESPTGTGKSLSIICGAIKWLKDHKQFEKQNLLEELAKCETEKKQNEEANDWLSSQSKEIEISKRLNDLKLRLLRIQDYEKMLEDLSNHEKVATKSEFKFKNNVTTKEEGDGRDDSDDENILIEDVNIIQDDSSDEDNSLQTYEPLKIYISSRTHSQLAQYIGEILKSPFGNDVRVVTLASRQTYCINPKVRNLKTMAFINERCLDLQKKKSSITKVDENNKPLKKNRKESVSCPYFRQMAIEKLKNVALANVRDVEDLIKVGEEICACPYYASRKAAKDAEIVLIPYNTLLHKATREANEIQLKNNVVIIDEAHNLLEALAQMYSTELKFNQIYHSLLQLKMYKNKFNTRFSAKTLLLINQLIFVISQLEAFMNESFKQKGSNIYTLPNFVISSKIENYNMFKLVQFCKDTRLAQKIRCYAVKYPNEELAVEKPKGVKDFLSRIKSEKEVKPKEDSNIKSQNEKVMIPSSNSLQPVIAFLESLTSSYEDGRILYKESTEKNDCKLSFLLLNSTSQFSEIIKYSRSVVVAGGTMKPVSEFRNRLFINGGAKPERIIEFSCDHIIASENILPIIVTSGPRNENLLFNFENRMKMGGMIKDIILSSCKIVRGGIVVFFPSYNYENWVWQQMKDVNFGREVFREPHNSGSVDAVLNKYASIIEKKKNALLFSVVGGKLSEGLNFSDDLGRCIILVGLPYANIYSPELKEKMSYLDKTEGNNSGQKFYENLCLKAVNQCIGRAVRHKNDYASVLLLDERYNRLSVKNALPNWIKKSLKTCNYGETFNLIREFFSKKSTT